MKRRGFLSGLSGLAGLTGLGSLPVGAEPEFEGKAQPFSVETLVQQARQSAKSAYVPRPTVPQPWLDLEYDQYKSIWFNTYHALWQRTKSPYRIEFFHPGLYFDRPIEINIVEDGKAQKVAFRYWMFFKTDKVPNLPENEFVGFSGFRLLGEIEKKDVHQEFVVMQGGAYFRAIGAGQHYGLSARGLTINTADPKGEEFPDFTRFFIEKPKPEDRDIVVHAYLDTASATGVFTFHISPGDTTVIGVTAKLFARAELSHFGLAAMSSMFLFDETNRGRFDDFRTAVHDSDGLLVHNGAGEILWRPLGNPKHLQVSSFVDENPKGFGLMQRPREFSNYADLEAMYHKRPGLWIEPGEDWGKGAVTLVEIPTNREIYDNIVAYWRPSTPLAAGEEKTLSYQMTWGEDPHLSLPVAPVMNTRMGQRFLGGHIATVDFADHPSIPDDLGQVFLHISSNSGSVSKGILQRNPQTNGVRLAFTFDPGERDQMEMRAQLMHNKLPVSEVWLYRWTAP